MEIKFKLSDALQNRNRLMNPMDFLIHDLFYDSPVYHEPQQQHHHQKTVNVVASPRNRMASRSGDEPISKGSETSSSRTMGLQRTIKTKTRGKTGCFLGIAGFKWILSKKSTMFVYVEEFIPIGNCTSHGQEVNIIDM
jgi:hypothetical protein